MYYKTFLFKESIESVVLIFMIMLIFREYNIVYISCIIVLLGLIYMYRLPLRKKVNYKDNIIISPCDGKVVDILEDKRAKMYKLSIEQSLSDVHVQWFPVNGLVKKIIYKSGSFDKFLTTKTTDKMITILQSKYGVVRVDQIPHQGLFGDIVNWTISNSFVKRGNLLGLTMITSQIDVYIPSANVELFVDVNDKMIGKHTPIGHFIIKKKKLNEA